MKIDLNREEMILILFCLRFTKFANPNVLFDSEDESEAIELRQQLIAKIFFALNPANSPD
jgi:hypothetical protein|tara:strand:- start:255 stop:434 length:180 start_codon:yes stop_codon:yes gene_type:complete